MVWLPRWGCDGMIFGSNQKLLMARAGAVPVDRSWDIGFASYSGDSYYFGVDFSTPAQIHFKPDGTELYVAGAANDDVHQLSMSTAWDISSLSYTRKLGVIGIERNLRGVFFKPDGLRMYICGTYQDRVNEYSLSTAWDISTASHTQGFDVSANALDPSAVFFKDDGAKMYVTGLSADTVAEYSLSTAWDISTASHAASFSVSGQASAPFGLYIKPDGTRFYIMNQSNDTVFQYGLSDPWSIDSGSYQKSFNVGSQETNPLGVFFKDDGLMMFVCGSGTNYIYAYDLA